MPAALHEIERLREIAFRAAGEGSDLPRDLDHFDLYYRHLFVWNARDERIVGAYRVGATDEIPARIGPNGLYTRTLFQYDERLLDRLGPALELGRAFVRIECQRDFSPLVLLWKGIGRLVAREPRYRCLFGTVSISNRYESLSRSLLVRFLRATRYRDDLAALVTPMRPPRPCPRDAILDGAIVASLDAVSRLVELVERDGKRVPVLLRQYLKLNARVLGFNVDPAFGDVLDGLMLVDLAEVEPAILGRYMGRDEAERFLANLRQESVGAPGKARRRGDQPLTTLRQGHSHAMHTSKPELALVSDIGVASQGGGGITTHAVPSGKTGLHAAPASHQILREVRTSALRSSRPVLRWR